MNRKQRRAAGKSATAASPAASRAVGRSPIGIAELTAAAVHHHRRGELAQAESYYRQILETDPSHFDGLHLLGVIAHQRGSSVTAARLIGRAIALYDHNREAHNKADFRSSLPNSAKVGPKELAVAHSNLSIALMELGQYEEALKSIQRSLQLAETENTKLLFVQCLRDLIHIPTEIDVRDNLVRALSEPWGRPIDLARFAANLLKRDGPVGAWLRRTVHSSSKQLGPEELFSAAELADITGDSLLRCILEQVYVFDIELERLFTVLRRIMLERAKASTFGQPFSRDELRLFCSLAQQCFINEYVFACSQHEHELVDQVREALADALGYGTPVIPESWVVAVAAYYPLAAVPAAEQLLLRGWSAPIAQIIRCQVKEVLEERRLRVLLPRLTAIDDDVSLAVKQQYEENPYPRWTKASPVGPATIEAHLRQKFPLATLRDVVDTRAANILIAGCGTGQHAIETARQFKAAQILAVDLSVSSLCYAKRRTQELQVSNVEYAQADILRLQSIGRTFDVIEASGVLHHLAEPIRGWQVLLSILRPGGFMRLGLYSKLARLDVSAARNFIAQRGYGSSVTEIRRARQDIAALDRHASAAKLMEWGDFYSTSACRDLLFHVQEHQMTLPEIDAFIHQNGLEFIGFDLPASVLQKFRNRFPHDAKITSLTHWHKFEAENSSVFVGMYQFWIRKPLT